MSKARFGNTKKHQHLATIPPSGLKSYDDTLTERCKFNFSYFCAQDPHGICLEDLSFEQLQDLFKKIQDFGRQSLFYWKKQKHGISTTLAVYELFPRISNFSHPKHVPHDVHWGRFRLSKEVRLIGFVVPPEFHEKSHEKTGLMFDTNTFYVVFLDDKHGFYKSSV